MRTLLRFAAYLRPHRGLLVLFLVTMLAVVASEMIMPRLLGMVIDRGIGGGSSKAVLLYTGLMFAVGLARSGIRYGQAYARERMGQELIRGLRHDLYARLQGLSFTFFTVNATGDLMSRLTSDVGAVMEFFGFGIGETITSTLMFGGTVAMLLMTDWHLALVVIIPLPVLMFFAFRFSSIVGPAWEKIRAEMGKLTTTLQENVSGVRVVKSFAREDHEIAKFGANNTTTFHANIGRAAIEARTFPILNFITGFCFFLLYWYGSRRVYSGEMSLGSFFSFNWYLWGLIWPIRFLGYLISVAKEAIAAGPRLFEVLDSPLRIAELPTKADLPAIGGHIRFEDVHFCFEDGDKTPVLKGLNLEILPGQIVAVLGGTGSGKSSIINLIPRFYDPQQGRITIDGLDIRQATLPTLRRQIGIVPQETFLFSDTVRNNIAFGRPDATPRKSRRRPRPRRPTSLSASCPRATTRASASAVWGYRADRNNVSPSPALC